MLIANPNSPDPITPMGLLVPLAAGLLLLAVGYDVIGELTHRGQRDTDAD
jgi:hypothetical protein